MGSAPQSSDLVLDAVNTHVAVAVSTVADHGERLGIRVVTLGIDQRLFG